MNNVIIAAATGYEVNLVLPFVDSLLNTDFNGELVLIIYKHQFKEYDKIFKNVREIKISYQFSMMGVLHFPLQYFGFYKYKFFRKTMIFYYNFIFNLPNKFFKMYSLNNAGFPQPSGGVIVPFFGIPCLTSTLASKMAQKTHCRLVGLSCFRREDGEGFDVYCDDLNDPQLYDRDIEIATTALNKAVENMINRFPTEYMWGYKRFKGIQNSINLYR
jgi:hypothetical protein